MLTGTRSGRKICELLFLILFTLFEKNSLSTSVHLFHICGRLCIPFTKHDTGLRCLRCYINAKIGADLELSLAPARFFSFQETNKSHRRQDLCYNVELITLAS